MTEIEKIKGKVNAAFADRNTTLQEWQRLEVEILQINKEARSRGEDAPFPALGYLEMVSMMTDPTWKEDDNGER